MIRTHAGYEDILRTTSKLYTEQLMKVYRFDNQVDRNKEEHARFLFKTNLINTTFNRIGNQILKEKISESIFSEYITKERVSETIKTMPLYEPVLLLITGEIELKSSQEINTIQKDNIARNFKQAGEKFLELNFFIHAEYAFKLAKQLYATLDENSEFDNCSYMQNKCKLSLTTRKLTKLVKYLMLFSCGFGYKPYRLIYLIFAVIIVFALALYLMNTNINPILLSASNYFSLGAFFNYEQMSNFTKYILIIESALSIIINSTFIALLGRLWFR